jgi:hypothetical protein
MLFIDAEKVPDTFPSRAEAVLVFASIQGSCFGAFWSSRRHGAPDSLGARFSRFDEVGIRDCRQGTDIRRPEPITLLVPCLTNTPVDCFS